MDSILGLAFLFAFQPRFTGLPVHEWMGLSLAGVVLIHLLLGWNWVVNISKKLLGKLPGQTRLLYVVNLALLLAFVGVAVTGVLVSKVVFPHAGENRALLGVHRLFANGILLLMALHLALNWQWVVNLWNKYAVQPRTARRALKPQPSSAPVVVYLPRQGSGEAR
ncbi:MAG: DUF4405 domain-containing protein [Thermaceae bacterium]|nr:DUF4405 domain-containing protein [Thermaceae bacterium]